MTDNHPTPPPEPMIPNHYRGNDIRVYREGFHAGYKYAAALRPEPPSLKQQALHALLHIDQGQHNERYHIIRRALEQLND
jgi:hypothetical protein